MAKPKLKKAQTGGYNDTSGKKKLGPALGIGIPVTAMAAAGANMIKNAVKRRKERKATEEETRKALENAKSQRSKKSDVPAPFNKRKLERAKRVVAKTGGTAKYKMGGAKKYQTGGGTDPYAYKMKDAPVVNNEYRRPAEQFAGVNDKAWLKSLEADANAFNSMDKAFYDSLGPVEPGRTRAAYHPSYSPAQLSAMKSRLGELDKQKRGGAAKATYKTGGMVNPNAKVSALKKAGSKGVKPNVNPKATAAKRATGRTGGTSTAPRTAKPKKNK